MKEWMPAILIGLLEASSPAPADTQASAVAQVRCTVVPTIGVQTFTPTVDAGTVRSGSFSATIGFRVQANNQGVSMCVQASPMYKGGNPDDREVTPIPLNAAAGVVIAPAGARPVGGRNVAKIVGPGETIDGFPTQRTETVLFESGQDGLFSQEVHVTVTWNQDDPARPRGEYSGKVKLTAMLMP